jgi:type I restriction enzyme S subunit
VVVNRSQYDPFFVYYVLSTFTEKVASIAGGVATPIVNKTSFENITLLSPPLTIQRKIAAILSAYDDLIENNLRRIKILEEMAQNLYREWFVKFRFPGYEKVKFVDSPLGMIPEGWDIVKLSDIGRIITGKTPSKAIKTNFGEYLPFIKTPDMHEGIFVFDTGESLSEQGATSQANKSIPAGTICVSCIGTIGIVCIATRPAQTNQQINSLILSNEKQREYIFFSLKAAKQTLINLGANGATMGNVNKGKFEALKVVAPSEEYFTLFHLNSVSIFRQIYTLSAANKNLKKTRDILIPKLISGEVDVSDLNIKVSEEVFE